MYDVETWLKYHQVWGFYKPMNVVILHFAVILFKEPCRVRWLGQLASHRLQHLVTRAS